MELQSQGSGFIGLWLKVWGLRLRTSLPSLLVLTKRGERARLAPFQGRCVCGGAGTPGPPPPPQAPGGPGVFEASPHATDSFGHVFFWPASAQLGLRFSFLATSTYLGLRRGLEASYVWCQEGNWGPKKAS